MSKNMWPNYRGPWEVWPSAYCEGPLRVLKVGVQATMKVNTWSLGPTANFLVM